MNASTHRFANLSRMFAFAAAVLASTAYSTLAATISWNAPQPISGDSDVSNAGTTFMAVTYSGTPVTINGVTFQDRSTYPNYGEGALTGSTFGGDGSPYGSGNAPFAALSPAYQTLLAGGSYNDGPQAVDINISGLTAGHNYQMEWWVNDSRNCCGNNGRFEGASSSLANVDQSTPMNYNQSGNDGDLGHFVIGNFVADGTGLQNFVFTSPTQNEQINAFQIRDLTAPTPEPSSLVLCGLGAAGLILVARRRRKA